MIRAAVRFLFFTAAALAATACAAPPPPRAAPSRPVPLETVRIGTGDYVAATDIAARLGLKTSWNDKARELTLSDARTKIIVRAESRELTVNGLRVFLGVPTETRRGKVYLDKVDYERCLLPRVRPALSGTPPPPPKIIALDPGHGGKDDGTENKLLGLKEKTLTLEVAFRLKKLLEAAGYKVVMTRTEDRELVPRKEDDPPLKRLDLAGTRSRQELLKRADLVNRAHADLFVSIHFNAAQNDTRGTEIFTYTPAGQHATDWWGQATKEDQYFTTADQPINRFDAWNVVLAHALQARMLQGLKTEDRGEKIAHWAILETLDCPGVLAEPAILTNQAEARRVATPAFQQEIAESLAAGIADYVAVLESLQPKPPAATRASRK
jgi:N-acetylmuramoyl-L-alanine amidase